MPSFLNLHLTKIKISIAHILFKVFTFFGKNAQKQIKRNNINFQVDLREGLDLSLYLFGSFQPHVFNKMPNPLAKDATIFDIGANIGAITLEYAKMLNSEGKVFAFEPTDFAFSKLTTNLSLNPTLSKKVKTYKCFVSDTPEEASDKQIFSSWRVDGHKDNSNHPVHGGTPMMAKAVPTISLDQFVEENGIKKVDLIKIDTDGHERSVIAGALKTLKQFRPPVVFECGKYLLQEKGHGPKDYVSIFGDLNYKLVNLSNNTELSAENIESQIPKFHTTDILAIPL